MKKTLVALIVCVGLFTPNTHAQQEQEKRSISKSISKRGKAFIRNKHISSVSIGIVKDGQAYSQHFGELEKGKGNPPDNESMYEIGSVSKTLTGHLLAQAVIDKKINLEDDIRLYLKEPYPNLQYKERPITVRHLVTHTSGLPLFLPEEMNGLFTDLNEEVPLSYQKLEKAYSKDQFLKDLQSVSLSAEPGTLYSYSNAGAELIGYILEKIYKKSIDELLEEHFSQKHDMSQTAIKLNENQQKKLVQGYWMGNSNPSPEQANKLWATAGGMRMNMADMLKYMKLQLRSEISLIVESHRILFENEETLKIAYFWRVSKDKYGTSYNHHGGTIGMQNWIFIFPEHDLGISIMTNQSGPKTPKILSKTAKKILKDLIKA